jgi:Fic family protein
MAVTMATAIFSPQYSRFTVEASNLLMRIAAALATVKTATILPAAADQLRVKARVGTVHFSTLIEGNELPVLEAERAARGELDPDTRAKIELVNYVNALDLIDRRLDADELVPDAAFLKELHATAMAGLGRDEDPHFKPHHEGEWRDGSAVVVDQITGQVMHEGPPPEKVPAAMEAMFEWLDKRLESEQQPVFALAGIVHYGITDIHPFADGNGRAARLFQGALLMRAGVLPGRIFSFERYYAEDRPAYYAALRSVRQRTYNMNVWLAYFLTGLAEEYERVAAEVTGLSTLTTLGSRPLQLSASQEAALTALRIEGRREFTRRDYERAGRVGRATAGNDLRLLIEHGVVEPRGSGPATRYAFTGAGRATKPDGRGRPVKWTEARIESALREFLAERTSWPSAREFAAAGRGDLYAAASRNGGIGRWRRAVGL